MALMPSKIISETEDPTIIAAAQDLYVLLHPGCYAALVVPTGCLHKARNAAIRASVGGWVENNLTKLVPGNGFMMHMWDIEGEASSGIFASQLSRVSLAR
jgi:hypothetical protein